MTKRLPIFLAFLVSLVPFAAIGQAPSHPTESELKDMSEQYAKLSDFYRVLVGNYLDTMNYAKIVERGITSMLSELDPHSVYLTEQEQTAAEEELGGGFSGIGVEFNVLNDTIIVVNTIAGGPAEKVGLASGDRIVTIDGANAVGMTRTDVPKHLRGRKGTKVTIGVFRRGTSEHSGVSELSGSTEASAKNLIEFTITRDDIPMNTVETAYKIDERTGYIKVSRFGATTDDEMNEALAGFGEVDGLILDLRGNSGGYLPQAIYMSELFLERGQRVVSTEGNMYPRQTYSAESTGRFAKGRLIVLVDEASASASEIVSGAVQDWDRGIVIGRPTFGKGLVQREFPLDDGSAVRLTIARYLTPTGRAIQRPYEAGHSDEYYLEHLGRYNAPDSLATTGKVYRTLRSERKVYGGGGIRPDVVLPADTTGYSTYWAQIRRGGLLQEFTQHYLDNNRAQLTSRYPDIESYIRDFDGAELLSQFADYAASHGVERDEQGLEKSHEWLSGQLSALIVGRQLGNEGFYRMSHATLDDDFRRAEQMMRLWRSLPYTPGEPVTDELVRRLAQ